MCSRLWVCSVLTLEITHKVNVGHIHVPFETPELNISGCTRDRIKWRTFTNNFVHLPPPRSPSFASQSLLNASRAVRSFIFKHLVSGCIAFSFTRKKFFPLFAVDFCCEPNSINGSGQKIHRGISSTDLLWIRIDKVSAKRRLRPSICSEAKYSMSRPCDAILRQNARTNSKSEWTMFSFNQLNVNLLEKVFNMLSPCGIECVWLGFFFIALFGFDLRIVRRALCITERIGNDGVSRASGNTVRWRIFNN